MSMKHTTTSKIKRASYKISDETSTNTARIVTAWLKPQRGKQTGIEPSMPRVVSWSATAQKQAGTPKDYYKTALTIPLLDHLITEIDKYFDPNNDAVMSSLLCLLPALLLRFLRRKPCASRFSVLCR